MAFLAVLLVAGLSGCSSEPDASPEGLPTSETGSPLASAANQTHVRMKFAGGDREAEMPIEATFAATDSCILGVPDCPAGAYKSVDLTSIVPAQVPVEISITLTVNSNIDAFVTGNEGADVLQASYEYNGGDLRIDVLVVRTPEGVVTLELFSGSPSLDAVQAGAKVTGLAHSISRSSLVPSGVPVAVRLGPGDVVNATGDGLERFVAYPPTGPAIQIVQYPYELRLADDAPEGDYFLMGLADEAIRLAGPNRTLTAHHLASVVTDFVDVPMGQEVSWDMPLEGFPVWVGLEITGKQDLQDCCGAAHYMGSRHVRLLSPDNVNVLTEDEDYDCLPAMGCQLSVFGNVWEFYNSEGFDEHLVPGTYTATVTIDQANNLQAHSMAMVIQ
jgi:hypothetical protein